MERTNITEDDEGKKIVDAHGEEIGVVTAVRGGTPYVDPDPGLGSQLMAKLGWEDVDEGDYALETEKVDAVTDDEIRLRQDM